MVSPLDQPDTEAIHELDDTTKEVPKLPLAIENAPSGAQEEPKQEHEVKIHTLDVGEGNVVKLDALGPMIINSDGTLSRIQNWLDLSPFEQERTVRLLVKKRNLVRLRKLDAENTEEDGVKLSALKDS